MSARTISSLTLALVLTGAGALFLFVAPSADALPTSEVEILWVDDNGNHVGSYFRGCSGERFSEGTRTGNTITYTSPCSNLYPRVLCNHEGEMVSCAIPMFINACVPHFGEAMCSFP